MIYAISAFAILAAVFMIGLVVYTVCKYGFDGSKNKESLR